MKASVTVDAEVGFDFDGYFLGGVFNGTPKIVAVPTEFLGGGVSELVAPGLTNFVKNLISVLGRLF